MKHPFKQLSPYVCVCKCWFWGFFMGSATVIALILLNKIMK